ncbi:MAG: T9SS type A sorting domain-containing protein, partial [Bacteroidetes bacterium]|nr:T9SS type A sorting domain-containing protein [Bacteroidota bacterium]
MVQFLPAQHLNYWNELPSPTQHTLSTVHFTDSVNGWISGQNGVFMRTTNGGTSWSQILPGSTGEVPDFAILSPTNIRAIEFRYPITDTSWFGTLIHHTTNGGTTWMTIKYDSSLFRCITFVDSLTGYLGGSYGSIAKTTDGGLTWREVNIGSFANMERWPIYKVRFHSPQFGMAVAGQLDVFGIVWRTTDGGEHWSASKISADPLFDVIFIDSLHILTAMGDLESTGAGFLRSLDGGETWKFENTTIWGEPNTFAYRTPSDCWVPMGTAGICLRSSNNGLNWQTITLPRQVPVYDISFPSERTGFMIGHRGALFKFNSSLLSVDRNSEALVPSRSIRSFPNPFNGSTTFTYKLDRSALVRAELYDAVGRRVAVLHDGMQSSGEHSVRWESDGSPSGMYILRVTDGHTVQIGKALLQR